MLFAAVTSRMTIQGSMREARKIAPITNGPAAKHKRCSSMCIPRMTDMKFSSLLPGHYFRWVRASLPSWSASASAAPPRTALAICARCLPGFCGASQSECLGSYAGPRKLFMLLYTTFSNWPKSSSDNVLKYPVVSSA